MSTAYAVDVKACIRCGACATVAPRNFQVKGGPARALRPAEGADEQRACTSAKLLCPTQAIAETAETAVADGPAAAPPRDLFRTLLGISEDVRWRMSELPWAAFDASKATAPLVAVVREMAYSEQTTFSATSRFMQAFGSDADFSQWVSVWFYEETRHPLVLLEWLARAGETHDDEFVQKGRESEPFMPSLTGTLVMNIVSEMVASAAYLHMVSGRLEPLLHAMVQRLCADEARHGASFFAYARRALATAPDAERQKLDALKVLHFWLNIGADVSHPVNQAMKRLEALLPGLQAPPFVPPNDRIAAVIGALTGLELKTAAELPQTMLEHTRRVRAAHAPSARV